MFDLELDEGVVLVARPTHEPAELHPEEAAALSDRAVARRRADFTAGRTAAREALAQLGFGPSPVRRGATGEPMWPEGVVGSITHTSGWALAMAAATDRSGGIGVDLEATSRYFPELVSEIAFAEERDRLAELTGDRQARAAVEVFAVKEAIYKAFYPRIREFFGFEAVRIAESAGGYLAAFVDNLDPGYPPGRPFKVRVHWFEDLVVAWLVLPPD